MATATATLSQKFKGLATYSQSSVVCTYTTSGGSVVYQGFTPSSITVPKWTSGRKRFHSYSINGKQFIDKSGFVGGVISGFTSDKSAEETWFKTSAVGYEHPPAALVQTASNTYSGEIVYDGGVWYSDWVNRVPLNPAHPIQIPQKELYRFIGCYSANATTGTKYINADGTPTAAFLELTPTDDFTIYAQFELASVKVTISASYGDFAFKTFYQSLTPDGDGKYGYFTDSSCTPESRIYGIPRPSRELYAWGGLRSSSSASGTLYANADGTFAQAFLDRTAKAVTVYGSFWTQVSYKVTVNASGGSADVLAYYNGKTDGGIFADWLCATPELQSLPIPSRLSYRFLGYFSSSSGGTKFADFDGVIQPALKTRKATTTIYAQWRQASSTVTLDPNGGIGGGPIYFDATDAVFFDGTSATVTSVAVPEYTGNAFLGYFDAQTGGSEIISAAGVLSPSYRPSGNVTLYAHWGIGKSIIDIEAGEGMAATKRFYYDQAAAKFYADADLTEEITSVALPVLRLFNTNGLFTESSGGTSVVSASGAILPTFAPTDEFVTVYAQYARRCFEVAIDAGGGQFDVSEIYHAPSGSTWYSDDALTEAVTNVGVNPRAGYTFGGCSYGGNQVISTDGTILSAALQDEDYTATAQWTAKTYTLTFNAYPGSPSFGSKTVTFDAPIGALPTATLAGRRLDGWAIDGTTIDPTDVWAFDADKTATANWHDGWGGCTDFFHLETANGPLMLVASNSGATRSVVETSHTGALAITTNDSSVGAFERSGILRNPVCTYRIKKSGSVSIQLGKAWSGSGSTVSGYMLVQAEYATASDGEPILVVRGVANEGADAINRWNVNLAVNPDHIAQDPLSAISGGGELTECKTLITCDPVVPFENGMPCASDIVHGKVVVTATTNAYFGESAPTARSPFIETNGVPVGENDVDFTTYAFQAERSL